LPIETGELNHGRTWRRVLPMVVCQGCPRLSPRGPKWHLKKNGISLLLDFLEGYLSRKPLSRQSLPDVRLLVETGIPPVIFPGRKELLSRAVSRERKRPGKNIENVGIRDSQLCFLRYL
jgi:hypothetical protein